MEFAFDHPTPNSTYGAANNHPYSSSLASSASSSSSSVFSLDGASSQGSTSSTSSSVGSSLHVVWETDASQSSTGACPRPTKVQDCPLPLEERQNPRRTNRCVQDARLACPAAGAFRAPSLVRQSDRKNLFVEGLVDCSAQIVEVIWPTSAVPHLRNEAGGKGVLPLKTFIQETLRRSRTSYSTLQVALYYLILIQPHVPRYDFTMEQPEDSQAFRALQCGRRMFLSALILASKYLQDRNYSSRAWSKISGLNSNEINMNEMTFLFAINWKLHISEQVFSKWTDLVLKMTSGPSSPSASPLASDKKQAWAAILPRLTPDLSCVELDQQHQATASLTPKSSPPPPPPSSYPALHLPLSLSTTPLQSTSQATTPTPTHPYPSGAPPPPPPPRVLEPSAHPTPPPTTLPPLLRLGPLPTPQLTPQSMGFSTPSSRRSSLGQALEFAAAAANSRATSPPLPTTALRRCSPPRFAPGSTATQVCRKRPSFCSDSGFGSGSSGSGSSDDGSRSTDIERLQQQQQMRRHSSAIASSTMTTTTTSELACLGRGGILEDSRMVLSPVAMAQEANAPRSSHGENGRKRRCCGEEMRLGRRIRHGPGMWKGIL